MDKPIVSFVIFNKSGIASESLTRLLQTPEDFELYIVDNGSTDDTWRFVESLEDPRIKGKKRFEINHGGVYAINYVLSHRKPNQYYVNIDSDVYIETDKWYQTFMDTFNAFPELGMIGATPFPELQGEEHPEYNFFITKKEEIKVYKLPGVIGCFICIRPEVLNILGYFSEETCGADSDIGRRIRGYTPYEIAAAPAIKMSQRYVMCDQCPMRKQCTLSNQQCFTIYKKKYLSGQFYEDIIKPKTQIYMKQLAEGKRTPYCASIHDEKSMMEHEYDKQSALENFNFFMLRDE